MQNLSYENEFDLHEKEPVGNHIFIWMVWYITYWHRQNATRKCPIRNSVLILKAHKRRKETLYYRNFHRKTLTLYIVLNIFISLVFLSLKSIEVLEVPIVSNLRVNCFEQFFLNRTLCLNIANVNFQTRLDWNNICENYSFTEPSSWRGKGKSFINPSRISSSVSAP